MIDLSHLRADFPILGREINGSPLAFLDSAASSQKPNVVIDAMSDFYRTSYANVHRGAYTLSAEATDLYEAARATLASFIGARPSEVVFTRGATTALNMVAWGWAFDRLEPGDRIVLTMMEHHANLIPWQQVAKRTGAELVFATLTADYEIDLTVLASLIDDKTKVVAVSGMSNVLGTITPVPRIAEMAHAVGAICVVDGAQLVPHAPVDVTDLGCDFLAIAGHKMLGPTGIGALWGKAELLEEMEPWETGGEMISDVQLHSATWADVPAKFEAGTPPIAQAIGLAAAVDYLSGIGMRTVRSHDMAMTEYALNRLAEVPGVTVYGPRNIEVRGGAIAFTMGDIHAHDLATVLDDNGVAVRAGHHCAKPLMRSLDVAATARASVSVYTTTDDIDALIEGLHRAADLFA